MITQRFVPRLNFSRLCAAAIVTSLLFAEPSTADNWPNWRGPYGNGVAADANFPTEWGANKNLAWQVELPGVGGSTPAIWEDFIFVTCPNKANENEIRCYSRTGKLRWKTTLGKERAGKHKKGSGSNPSPVTDGKHVFCYYKSGDVACLDFAGDIVWKKNLQETYGKDTLWWDLGTSPVLTDSALVVAVIQSGPSYLVALEKETGRVSWKHDRMLGAPEEAAQTYATPIVFGNGEDQRLIVLGADHVTAHNAGTGEELWRFGGMNPDQNTYFRSISSPVLSGVQSVIAPYARGTSLSAIRLGGTGEVRGTHLAWEHTQGPSADVPTPAARNGSVYVLTDKGTVAVLDAKTGRTRKETHLPKNRNAYSASPVLAGNKLYLTREDATTFVLTADDLEIIAENALDDRVVATPVLVDEKIFLRAASALYCITE